jgi:hypothetical protein
MNSCKRSGCDAYRPSRRTFYAPNSPINSAVVSRKNRSHERKTCHARGLFRRPGHRNAMHYTLIPSRTLPPCGGGSIPFGTRCDRGQVSPSPLAGEGWDGGETLGRSAPLMRTPTPPSPVEGEGPAPRLTTKLVPNSIDLPPPRGEGVLTYPCQPLGGKAYVAHLWSILSPAMP